MKELLEEAIFINHINFSGMNLGDEQLRYLIELFKNCQFLLGIHLSDNDITNNPYFHEIVNGFHISNIDLCAANRDYETHNEAMNTNNTKGI
jgi:hypothetical protein